MISDKLKQQLQDLEINPPAKSWESIAASLDEEVYAAFPEKLSLLELAPPATAWEKIQEKLSPEFENLSSKLFHLEVEAPLSAWKNIAAALDENKVQTLQPKKSKVVPFLKYAAAACLVGVLAFGAIKLFSPQKNDATATTEPKINQPQRQNNITKPEEPAVKRTELSNNLPTERRVIASNKNPEIETQSSSLTAATYMNEVVSGDFNNEENLGSFQQASLHGDVPGSSSLLESFDRYIVFTNDDGNVVRLSKKMADALGCVYNNATSEQRKYCQDQKTN